MIGIIAGTVAGVFLGIISGLFPGVHSNTLAASLLGMQAFLLPVIGVEALAATMFAALITHTFLDSIPSTSSASRILILRFPFSRPICSASKEKDRRQSGLPHLAVPVQSLLSIPLSMLLFFILPPLQPYLDWWMGIILVAVIGYLMIECESPGWALMIFGISGLLGIFTFRYAFLGWHTLGESGVLMPLLTGMFGISVLLFSSRGPVPEQRFSGIGMTRREIGRGTVIGTIAGTIVGWLPGLSNATANAVLCSKTDYRRDRRAYIFSTSAANTANAIIGLAALFAIGRERNGVMVAISSVGTPSMASLLVSGALAACLAYPITIWLSGYADRLNGIDGKMLNYVAIILIILISFLISGLFGLFILALACIVGLIPRMVNISRVFCMGAIMIPVILYSFGIGGF